MGLVVYVSFIISNLKKEWSMKRGFSCIKLLSHVYLLDLIDYLNLIVFSRK